VENTIEELEGCMCEYISEHLRNQIESVADQTEAYPSQVMIVALQIGLAVILGKTHSFLSSVSMAKHGPVKQRKGKLSGKGV
jgi:hypothetical protein